MIGRNPRATGHATRPRLLILAATTGYQIRGFGPAADALGVDLTFASDRCDQLTDPWWDEAIPVRFQDPDVGARVIQTATGDQPPDGILALGDRPVPLAARVAGALGLPGHPPAAADATCNKLASRTRLRDAGLPVPWFCAVPRGDDARAVAAELPFPVVVKPLALSGSRGVMRANDPDEFVTVFGRLGRLLEGPDLALEPNTAFVLIESFVSGVEYAVEAILDRGAFRVLAVFDKPDPLDGPFFEETIYVTPSRASAVVQEDIRDAVSAAARALGLYHGPIHAECRVSADGVYVLEVAARPIGGLCARMLRFAGPEADTVPFEQVLIRHALDEDVVAWTREAAAAGVMMIPVARKGVLRRVDGIGVARRVAGIFDVRITAELDSLLLPLPDARSYLGFLFASAATPFEVETALRNAHRCLSFAIDPAVPLA